jgi:hypothetical protein
MRVDVADRDPGFRTINSLPRHGPVSGFPSSTLTWRAVTLGIRVTALPALFVVGACATTLTGPRIRQEPIPAATVHASFGRVWNAVIDIFADQNLPIRTIDRSSGFIATDDLRVAVEERTALRWADCGMDSFGAIPAGHATYNVVVRGDSITSIVRVTVRWTGIANNRNPVECVSRGLWERDFEDEVKERAERP